MISGTVRGLHAEVPVTFRLEGLPDLTLEFVVDTGFVGYLTLPLQAVTALGLPFEYDTSANLADDSEVQMAVHSATILWQGVERTVRVLAAGRRPLLGMALLSGSELMVQCVENGVVTIEEL